MAQEAGEGARSRSKRSLGVLAALGAKVLGLSPLGGGALAVGTSALSFIGSRKSSH